MLSLPSGRDAPRKGVSMGKVEQLENRVAQLEDIVGALTVVTNKLLEDVYEPEFMEKIDKLAIYGKECKES